MGQASDLSVNLVCGMAVGRPVLPVCRFLARAVPLLWNFGVGLTTLRGGDSTSEAHLVVPIW